MKNPPWTRDEHILALDFYLRHVPSIPGKESKEVFALSKALNELNAYLDLEKSESYRNPSGVYMKLMNFRRFDPSYVGVGLSHGSKDEQIVWDLYANSPEELAQVAEQIMTVTKDEPLSLPALSEEEEESNEGQLLSRLHRYRERDRSLVTKKKSKFLQVHSRLFCQACGLDFEHKYGDRGKGFIECHHTKPISAIAPGDVTKLSDLILLCSNCHRMVHRQRPWLSYDEIKSMVKR